MNTTGIVCLSIYRGLYVAALLSSPWMFKYFLDRIWYRSYNTLQYALNIVMALIWAANVLELSWAIVRYVITNVTFSR